MRIRKWGGARVNRLGMDTAARRNLRGAIEPMTVRMALAGVRAGITRISCAASFTEASGNAPTRISQRLARLEPTMGPGQLRIIFNHQDVFCVSRGVDTRLHMDDLTC